MTSSSKSKRSFFLRCGLLLTMILLGSTVELRAEKPKHYDYDWESLKKHPGAEWFEDAKFGIFIHWGPYSVMGHCKGSRGYAEHAAQMIYRDSDYYYDYLENNFGAAPPEFGYKDFIPLFKAEKWEPQEWAELFEKAGAKYVVLTAEHHDGFAMWDSKLTPWCATKMGPMRDLVGDLGKAVRKRGLKYAPSYHRERHTGYFAQHYFRLASPPHADIAEEIKRMPEAASLYGPFSYSDAFIADYVARWKELEEKYQPDFMWIDDIPIFYHASEDDPQMKKYKIACRDMIADYMNVAAEKWNKEISLNNKGRRQLNWPAGVGCLESDNLKLKKIGPKWENPATLGTSYGYMKSEEEQDAYKSSTELVHLLCDTVSKNGNLLLNIGPRADGTIPEGMQKRLLAIGKWLETNGEAIYGTRPWTAFAQKQPKLRFTTKGKSLYAILLEKTEQPFVIKRSDPATGQAITKVSLLGSDAKVEWSRVANGIQIVPPKAWPGLHAWAFKLE